MSLARVPTGTVTGDAVITSRTVSAAVWRSGPAGGPSSMTCHTGLLEAEMSMHNSSSIRRAPVRQTYSSAMPPQRRGVKRANGPKNMKIDEAYEEAQSPRSRHVASGLAPGETRFAAVLLQACKDARHDFRAASAGFILPRPWKNSRLLRWSSTTPPSTATSHPWGRCDPDRRFVRT